MNDDAIINTKILTVRDIIVTLYFLLLLFKFLYDSTPPILNIPFIYFGVFSFIFLFFRLSEFLKFCIGLTLLAFRALDIDDRYIIINPNTIAIIIGIVENL